MSPIERKPVFCVSDLVQHKPGFTATEVGWRLWFSDMGRKGIVHVHRNNKGADQLCSNQLCSYCTADLRLCFCIKYEWCKGNCSFPGIAHTQKGFQVTICNEHTPIIITELGNYKKTSCIAEDISRIKPDTSDLEDIEEEDEGHGHHEHKNVGCWCCYFIW